MQQAEDLKAVVYDTKGKPQLALSIKRSGSRITVRVEQSQEEFSLLLRNIRVKGGEAVPQGSKITVPTGCKELDLDLV